MQANHFTSQAPFAMKPGQRFSHDHRSTFSLLVGCEAGEDIVAMVTTERAGSHVDWDALVWRGPVVSMEISGTCANVPQVIEAQIRKRIADVPTKSWIPPPEERVARMNR
jgi:hypothetical protein